MTDNRDNVDAEILPRVEATTYDDPSVTYINAQVLDAASTSLVNSAPLIADQSAAMMVEDWRAFVQGNEQVLMIAISKCLAKIVETDGAEGKKALKDCTDFMETLITDTTNMGAAAGGIAAAFK